MGIISSLSILVPLLIGLIYFRRLENFQKWFWGFIILSALVEIVSSYFAQNDIPNLWIFKIFLILDFLFFVYLYAKKIKYPVWKKYVTAFVAAVLCISELFLKNKFLYIQNDSLFFVSIFLFFILQSSFVIVAVFDDFEVDIRKNYIFWIAFARLFYYLIIVFIYVYPSFIENGYKIKLYNDTNLAINTFANILMNLIYGISLLCHKKKI